MAGYRTTGIGRRVIAVLGATLLILALAPVPSIATGHGGFGDRASTRTARHQTSVSGREAAAAGITGSVRHALASPLPRPAGFASSGRSTPLTSLTPSRAPRVVSTPPILSTHRIDGLSQAELGGLEPPDPWVAVSGSFIVQSTNGAVVVYNRVGSALAIISTEALFSIPAGYADSDPRILWDAYHGRWVGVLFGYNDPDDTDTFLSIIVSDGADPLGSWNVYQFGYGNSLPDFPGIASSTDKLVITVNEYTNGATFAGTSFLSLAWSSILAGTTLSGAYLLDPFDWGLRAARPQSSSADLHMIYESSDTGTIHYFRLSGSALSPVIDESDLGISNGADVLDHAPRQPGDADGIVDAVDGRVPDAVWRNGSLWFARTVDFAWDTINNDLAIEVFEVLTGGASPVIQTHAIRGGPAGTDAFIAGVGISGNQTFFLTYTTSSASDAPATIAEAESSTYGFLDPIVVATSAASYAGTRWGDYSGIALDPSGTGTVWHSSEVAAADGTWQSFVSRLVLDITPPTVTPPVQSLVSGSTLGASVPVRVSWTGADPGSGIVQFRLDEGPFGDPPTPIAYLAGTSMVRAHAWKTYGAGGNYGYGYQVAAWDDAGNSASTPLPAFVTAYVYQQTAAQVTYGGSWHSTSSSSYSGGSARYSSTAGSSATFRTSGRAFAFVTTRASTRGRVRVYVDGVLKTTLTLTSSTTRFRNLAYVLNLSSSATHTVKLVVYSGRVDVDAFVVLR